MSRERRSMWRSAAMAVVCVGTLLSSTPAWAQKEDDAFNDGLKARDDKKWEETATHMRRALSINPKESTRRIGGRFGLGLRAEYLPHYFLGEALFSAGDCVGAVEQWAISEQQGAIKARQDFLGFVQKSYVACKAKGVLPPAEFDPLLARTQQQVAEVTSFGLSVQTTAQQNPEILARNRDLASQYDRSRTELQAAESRLAAAKKTRQEREFTEAAAAADRARGFLTTVNANLNAAVTVAKNLESLAGDVSHALQVAAELDRSIDTKKAGLTSQLAIMRQSAAESMTRARPLLSARPLTSAGVSEARTLVNDATTKLKQIVDELDKATTAAYATRLADAIAKGNQQMMWVEQSFATLTGRMSKAPSVPDQVPTQRDGLQKRFEGIRRRYNAAVDLKNVGTIDETTRLASNVQTEVDAITASFGPLTLVERVGEELAGASRQFLAGDYTKVIATLDPSKVNNVALQLHVHLFRAASFYAMYVRSGEKDEASLTQARAEVDRCKQLNSTFAPDSRVFAPRFITFFQNGTASATPAVPSGSSPQ